MILDCLMPAFEVDASHSCLWATKDFSTSALLPFFLVVVGASSSDEEEYRRDKEEGGKEEEERFIGSLSYFILGIFLA